MLSLITVSAIALQWLVYLPQVIPLSSAFAWWFKFFWNLIRDPRGRSLLEILCNPRYVGCERQSRARVSQTKCVVGGLAVSLHYCTLSDTTMLGVV